MKFTRATGKQFAGKDRKLRPRGRCLRRGQSRWTRSPRAPQATHGQ